MPMPPSRSFAWGLAAIGSFSFVCAAATQPAPPGDDGKTQLVGQIDLVRVVDLCAERLGVRVDYDPRAISGAFTLRDKVGLDSLELWSLLNEQLSAREMTTVRTAESGGFSVVKTATAAQATRAVSARTVEELHAALGSEPWPGFVVVQSGVRHRKASSIAKALQAGSSRAGSGGSVTQLAEADVLVIADLRARVEDTLRLLELLDRPIDAVVSEYPARSLTPSMLVSQAKEIVTKRDAVSGEKTPGDLLALTGKPTVQIVAPESSVEYWRTLLDGLDRVGTLVETRTYTPKVFPAKDVARLIEQVVRDAGPNAASSSPLLPPPGERTPTPTAVDTWRLVIDDLTGSLIITATAAQHARILELLDRLDATPADATQQVRVFAIKHRAVAQVAAALAELLDTESPAGTTSSTGLTGAATTSPSGSAGTPAPSSSSSAPRPVTSVGVGAQTNTARTTIDEGRNAIIMVADPRTIAQAEALLVTLDIPQPQVMVEVVLVSLSEGESNALGVELQKFGSLNGNAIQLASLFGASSGGPTTTPGLGFTGTVLNAGDFTAVVKAFEALNDGRSTSIPRVLVGNNEEATFSSIAQQPTSTVSTNTTSTTVTGFGGFQDAGTKITIKPQIADGDRLVITYNVELSAFTSNPTGGLPGARQQNSVNSVATLPDGHAVVVGGLEVMTETDDESRVPILGEMPLIGNLFKSRSTTSDRTRFFVLIRANVMRDSGFEDLKYVSGRTVERNSLDLDDGWPKVEPRVIK
jgi:general secretion pathway protein D